VNHPTLIPAALVVDDEDSPEMSVNTSMKARGLFGSVGGPGAASQHLVNL